jgi:phospholipid/cholesterol/gamma-HCH transport system substrate-binding protein
MLTRQVRLQLLVFSILTVLGLVAMALGYLHVPTLLGLGQIKVEATFSDGARIYPTANITYRGAQIGKVTDVRAAPDGALVTMSIASSAHIPSDVTAEIHSVSAVGEQYVDFVPRRDGQPYLHDGARLPVTRTQIPVQTGPLLDQVERMVASLPRNDLSTVLTETATAFGGQGQNLQRLLDSTRSLVHAAASNVEPTRRLIRDLAPLLDTQITNSAQIRALFPDLAAVSDQLRQSDPDIRGVLDKGQSAARQVKDLFQDLRPTLPILLANLTTVGDVLATYNTNLRQVLILYPIDVAMLQSIAFPYPEGTVGLDFRTNVNVPAPCTTGFEPASKWRNPNDVSIPTTPAGMYCKLAQDAPSVVRGARNTPCPDSDRRAATPVQCGVDGRASGYPGGPMPHPFTSENPLTPAPIGAPTPPRQAPYDPRTGLYEGPDGQLYTTGGMATDSAHLARAGWKALWLEPLNQ